MQFGLLIVVVVRPSRAMMTSTNNYVLEDRVLWVLRWLIRPILALHERPHVGQTREESNESKAVVEELAALDLRSSRFCLASSVRFSSCIRQPALIRLRQVGRSSATVSQVSISMSKDFREALSVSLKRFFCPPTERLPSESSP